ncbi:MAG: TnsA endonuclease N-terminal domain-containing protein [Bacteroidota bacterium]
MPSRKNAFPYKQSRKVSAWNCQFDSLTELKYAISIMDKYHFLRSPVSIYYHPGTKITLDKIRRCHLRYTPDFLIRHKQTYQSFLVEIKPRAFENHPQLALRKAVAENYIARKNLDWIFKIVFDDLILLNEEQLKSFEEVKAITSDKSLALWFKDYCLRSGQAFPDNMLSDLIISGPHRTQSHWKQMRLL